MEAGAQDGGAGEEAAAAGDDGDRTGEWGLGGATNSGYLRVNPGRESRRVIAVSRFKS